MKKKRDIALTLICVLLGFIIALQLRSVTKNNVLQSTENLRADEIQVILNEERARNDTLNQQLQEYKTNLEQYRKEASQSGDYTSVLTKQLEAAEILSGQIAVEGTGVIVTMQESNRVTSENPMNDVIHDDDILRVINELRGAGAEALSINDERILSISEIRCAGATVSVNNNRYGVPFVIKAIGDPKTLEAALMMRHGTVEVLDSWGIDVTVVKSNRIKINAYSGATSFKYAVPVQKGS
jgi:uncharacterized protein YlxW (UPF0749 family)